MADADLAFAGAARQAELVRGGEMSSRELVELYLERIARIDPELNSYRVVMAERALAEADQADGRRGGGEDRPLLGVPVAVKDNHHVAAETTENGTAAAGGPVAEDGELVRRLREAGAVVVGKTRLSELAVWPFTLSGTWGVTRNPWDTQRTPGGSSGGSGAAVAAGLAGLGTASDGGGSIRIPAACCGLFGLKPQRNRISLEPDADHWYGLSVAGAVTRTVMDTAVFLDAVAAQGTGFADAARTPPGKLRVAVSLAPPSPPAFVSGEAKRAVEETAAVLESLGHEVDREDPDYGVLLPLFMPRWLRGIYDDAETLERPERLERRTRDLARLGSLVPGSAVARARAAEPARAERIGKVFAGHDVLLTPAMPTLPPNLRRAVGRSTPRTIAEAAHLVNYCVPWNITGQPAASVPAGFTGDGLPLAVQLVGRPSDEATLLSLAAQIESERPWADRRPPEG